MHKLCKFYICVLYSLTLWSEFRLHLRRHSWWWNKMSCQISSVKTDLKYFKWNSMYSQTCEQGETKNWPFCTGEFFYTESALFLIKVIAGVFNIQRMIWTYSLTQVWLYAWFCTIHLINEKLYHSFKDWCRHVVMIETVFFACNTVTFSGTFYL